MNLFYPLPLWERVASEASRVRGLSFEVDIPLTRSSHRKRCSDHPLPRGEREESEMQLG
jgi:hypothetical protein